MIAGLRIFSAAAVLRRLAGHALRPIALSTFLLDSGAARPHATWADGTSVPEWVTKACCGPDDAHHLRPDQVHRVPGGYMIDGYPRIVYDFQTSPSQDGEYWAFYGTTRDADGQPLFTSIFCFFASSWDDEPTAANPTVPAVGGECGITPNRLRSNTNRHKF